MVYGDLFDGKDEHSSFLLSVTLGQLHPLFAEELASFVRTARAGWLFSVAEPLHLISKHCYFPVTSSEQISLV